MIAQNKKAAVTLSGAKGLVLAICPSAYLPICLVLFCLLPSAYCQSHYTASLSETNTASDTLARHAAFWRGDAISINWTPPSGASGDPTYAYNIYRGTTSGNETGPLNASPVDAGCVAQADCTYVDYGPQAGTTYYYEATTVNGGVESSLSNESGTVIPADAILEASATTESLAASHKGIATLAETLGPASDALARHANEHRGLTDALSAANDSLAASHGQTVALTSTGTVSDSVARSRGQTVTPIETSTVSDSVLASQNSSQHLVATLAEPLGPASDTLARKAAWLRGPAETNPANDTLARQAALHRGLADPLSAANDTLSKQAALHRGLSEPLSPAGDTLARLAAHFIFPAETYHGADSLAILCTGHCERKPRPVRHRHWEF